MLFAICGPSKSGKSTILNEILRIRPDLKKLITLTTRSPRPGELDGVDYFFVSKSRFQEMDKDEEIIYPIIHRGEYYGIRKSDLLACKVIDTISVLRPDGITPISKYVPIKGIYVEMDVDKHIYDPDDEKIYNGRNLCSYFVQNIYGNMEFAVHEILLLIHGVI